ncbi:MAG: capsule assembly Wzi family protein [Polymorphobacter sp.]|uniref:capsule assembly Wzi family protein n=1 Tax=Polymorphobacter sp. TaxID=1909290 RepID=UPI003A88DBD9
MRPALLRVAAALFIGAAAPALAGPFAEVGDRQLRQDVALLAGAGLIRGPVDSWPLPWAQIDAGLNRARDGRTLPPHLAAAVRRLDRLADYAAQGFASETRLMATNRETTARDFGTLARGRGDVSTRIEVNTDAVSVSLGGGYRTDQPGTGWHVEPSQITLRLGNVALYAGNNEQWFGPGVDGALLFSNSARPMPKIGIKMLNPDQIDFPVLRWLGPLRLDFFGGVLNEDRDFRNTLTFGTRLSFMPSQGLEIGLNRAQMVCGQGRPCGFSQIFRSFVGVGNSDNPDPSNQGAFDDQAGNQLAGFDISYTHNFRGVMAKLYFEGEAEDFDNVLLEQWGRLIGLTLTGAAGSNGASYTTTIEYSDTLAVSLFNDTPLEGPTGGQTTYPGSFYNNSLYTSGYTYRGRPIGHWTAGDSRNLAVHAALTDTRNRRWYGSVRSVHLNVIDLGNPPRAIFPRPDGSPGPLISNPVSTSSEKFAILTAGAELPLKIGDVRIETRWQSDNPSTPGQRDPRAAIEVQFRQRF